ncbi:3-oxoacyl-[acyl-carrier-protein] synthase, KASII [hydrothermal vent metagenome]|uniref:3-oxoacyl-[acyl-carrier-protein] synthase, KASII n=1 Tax=hydrothermal vent metagenome TaxID=652676 RepID=A0A3B1CJR1_9ZZZZ
MRRVVITGIGAVTPLGLDFQETWKGLKKGLSGLSGCSRVEVDDIPWKVTGELRGFDALSFLTPKEKNRLDPFIQYSLAAALSAFEDASLGSEPNIMVIIGSSRGGVTRIEESLQAYFQEGRPLSAYLMPATTISMAPSYIAHRLGLKGYCLGISNACASGTMAIGEAFRLIGTGYADIALTGGTEAPLCRLCLEGYGRTGALSTGTDSRASRPFDRDRDGFVLSEGACVLVVEEMQHAVRRGAAIYAEIVGYAGINDGFHQTQPSEAGEAATIRLALQNAGITMDEIDMINAHGTSTVAGDRVEALALKEVFGRRLKDIRVTANKSMTGHMLAASGALEAATTAMSLHEGVVTPTINLAQPDRECGLNISSDLAEKDMRVALSTSFGFGGINAALVLKKV